MDHYTDNSKSEAPESLVSHIVQEIVEKQEYHEVHLFGDAFAKSVVTKLTEEGFEQFEPGAHFSAATYEAYMRGVIRGKYVDVKVRSFYFLGFSVSITATKGTMQ